MERYAHVRPASDCNAGEFGRHDSDHRKRKPVNGNRAPDDGGIGAEAVLPIAVPNDRAATILAIFIRREEAAMLRCHSEHLEEIAGVGLALREAGGSVETDVQTAQPRASEDAGERFRSRLNTFEVAIVEITVPVVGTGFREGVCELH